MSTPEPKDFLNKLFQAAFDAANPDLCVPANLPPPPKGRTIVVGAGKGAAAMALAVEKNWSGDLSGLVVTRYGHGAPCQRIEVVEASHPVPDAAGQQAAKRILDKVQGLSEDDLVIALISGGGSALLSAPAEGLTLEDKQAVNRALLASGAAIQEMNCVRKHLSSMKGGRLAQAAYPARVFTLVISDVPGDDPAVVASGPTVPDTTTREDALAIIRRYNIEVPASVMAWLAKPESETPKADDPRLVRCETRVISTAQASLLAAAEVARAHGVTPLVLGDMIEGESSDAGKVLAGIAKACAINGTPVQPPCVLLSGGETTVTLGRIKPGQKPRGGRNSEFLLSLAIALDGMKGIHAVSGDTDGIDGSEDNAGAIVTDDTLARARAAGIDARTMLDQHDAYGFFLGIDDLIVTGPTLTNVNDFRAIYVEKKV
ncbi:MAG: glycerate kinase [Methyloversatilis sp.]|nr:glycerate kinase [Methyloversatilis sp.]